MEAHNKPTITKEWLAKKISENPNKVIGRALLAIYQNQTHEEQHNATTTRRNGIGFAKPDARIGTIGARQFAAHAILQQWVIKIWSLPARDGYPRICKYASQLNEIALAKKARVCPQPNTNLVIL
jgi:hypothetical protein